MEHIQELDDYLSENESSGEKVTPIDYDQKNLLFLSTTCKALIETDYKCFMVATTMAAIGLEWADYKEWFEAKYIGKKERSN